MAIPNNIEKQHILNAISKIDTEGIPKDGDSHYYDLQYNGKTYPPKLVISYANIFANGTELDRNSFSGGENTKCFKILKDNGFIIEHKSPNTTSMTNVWVEKTIVNGRPDRTIGDRSLGNALWSPIRDKRGADIYKNMREVKPGDIILHLVDNQKFIGVSKVKDKAVETNGIAGTDWNGPAYLIKVINYIELNPAIERSYFLNENKRDELLRIANNSEVFYTNDLNLRQGAYLTPCPNNLAILLNNVYYSLSGQNIPYLDSINLPLNSTEKVSISINKIKQEFQNSGLHISSDIIRRFVASLITKPFVILTGLSGSGKTKLAQAFAMWICENDNQYCIVPVGADWTNREPLLGFPNALESNSYIKPDNGVLDLIIEANKNIRKPFFLILDEMNLSHVERYFADFLSVMESKNKILLHSGDSDWNDVPATIGFPKNLFIIGTVNIDETTYMFSPKVLDRASVIEFRVTAAEMERYLGSNYQINIDNLKGEGKNMAESFVALAKETSLEVKEVKQLNKTLMNFFDELKKTGTEFGYRSASEIIRFAAVADKLDTKWKQDEITDAAIMQKLLPKVHGSRRKIIETLEILAGFCFKIKEGETISEEDKKKAVQLYTSESKVNEKLEIIYPISLEKISRMIDNAIKNGFTSYAEA